VAAFACCAAPQPAQAINPVKPICSLAGLVSTLAGKLCSVAGHGKHLLDAGKKLLGGHLGGAVKTVLGGGGAAANTLTIGAALAGSDELSQIVSSAAGNADGDFLAKASSIAGGLSLISHSPFIAFFVGLFAAAATLVLWCELLIRSAAVYVIVLMLPLFFAALV